MNIFRSLLVPFLVLVTLQAFGQAQIRFQTESHDFGSFEEGVVSSFTFEITNVGNSPLILSNVQPSCGCTTPEWTKEPVLPGAKAKITASYNSNGRPGAFNKTITVLSNATEPSKTLTIKGVVLHKEDKPKTYSPAELQASPRVQLEKNAYNFGKIESNQAVKHTFKITNSGKSPLKINGIQTGCYCVTYTVGKPIIAPSESTNLELTYSPKSTGSQSDVVSIITNDIVQKTYTIQLQATVVKSLSNQSIMSTGSSNNPFK